MARGYTIDPIRLRLTRVRADLTQTELAELIGATGPQLSTYERGHAQPSVKTIQRLAAALDVDPVDLLTPVDPAQVTLADLRVRASLNQADIAAGVGINDRNYSAIERGELGLTPAMADQLAATLQVKPERVITAYLNARRQRQQRGAPVAPLRENHVRSPDEPPVPYRNRGPRPFTPPPGYE